MDEEEQLRREREALDCLDELFKPLPVDKFALGIEDGDVLSTSSGEVAVLTLRPESTSSSRSAFRQSLVSRSPSSTGHETDTISERSVGPFPDMGSLDSQESVSPLVSSTSRPSSTPDQRFSRGASTHSNPDHASLSEVVTDRPRSWQSARFRWSSEGRKSLAGKLKEQGKIPVVFEHAWRGKKNMKRLSCILKCGQRSTTMGLCNIARRLLEIKSNTGIYLVVQHFHVLNGTASYQRLLPGVLTIAALHERYAADDGLLYISFATEDVFG